MLSERTVNGLRGLRHLGVLRAVAPSLPSEHVAPSPHSEGSVLDAADPGIGPGTLRRLLDVAVAFSILSMVWPIFVVLALATRLSTGGSAIYRQIRVGQGGVPFTLFKFRTMRAWMTGPEVTAPGDDRVTRLGTLLRRAKVDELPQLVNVLAGHMTLVGPRPETVALAARYRADLKLIFRYRPGVTGPGQVLVGDEQIEDGVADVESFYLNEFVPRRVAIDLDYLRDPTLGRTVRWLADTVFYMARGSVSRSDGALHPARTEPVVLGPTPDN
jgi:lipopolysaccharide/colanic/teichoic acid biosynthesis glycosyltransferase